MYVCIYVFMYVSMYEISFLPREWEDSMYLTLRFLSLKCCRSCCVRIRLWGNSCISVLSQRHLLSDRLCVECDFSLILMLNFPRV